MEKINKGWIVTWSAIGINLACGLLYSWSVYAAALVQEMGFTKTNASIPYTIAMAMLALLSIPGGKLQDKIGPRFCGIICGVLCGAGLVLSGFMTSIAGLALTFGLITGSGIGLAYGATTPASVKWFPASKRGLISGMVVAGVGLASVYVAPMVQALVNLYGLHKTMIIQGILVFVVIIILSQFLKNPPEGYVPQEVAGKKAAPVIDPQKKQYNVREMVKTKQFWLMWFMYAFASFAGVMVIGHLAMIAKLQTGTEWAFIFVAILAIFNSGGRVFGGLLSDKIGRRRALMIFFLLQAVNMLAFKFYGNISVLLVGVLLTGVCYGSLLSIFPAMTFDYFGMKNGGMNYGIVFTSWGVAGVVGPLTGGAIADATGAYYSAYMIAAVLLIAAFALVIFLREPTFPSEKY